MKNWQFRILLKLLTAWARAWYYAQPPNYSHDVPFLEQLRALEDERQQGEQAE